jgi:hypothetical protein
MTDYLLPFQPSLAQGTNTRLDSACKHIQQCRVSTDDMMRFVMEDGEELQRNKYRYCVHKDELVVGIGRPWDARTTVKRVANSAYPRVISNLGCLADREETRVAINMIRFMNHYARTVREKAHIVKFFQDDVHVPPRIPNNPMANMRGKEAFHSKPNGSMGTRPFLKFMYDYFTVGFANTLGYAHANSGDTMTSVMIGGLRTVQNGDFEIFPGDLVQFYWSFEREDFQQDGRRKPYLNIWNEDIPCNVDPKTVLNAEDPSWQTPADAQIRQAHYDLGYGQRADKMKVVAKIKPYFRDDEHPRLMDWYRVFGVAIASARPNEMCDIKIARQSM